MDARGVQGGMLGEKKWPKATCGDVTYFTKERPGGDALDDPTPTVHPTGRILYTHGELQAFIERMWVWADHMSRWACATQALNVALFTKRDTVTLEDVMNQSNPPPPPPFK